MHSFSQALDGKNPDNMTTLKKTAVRCVKTLYGVPCLSPVLICGVRMYSFHLVAILAEIAFLGVCLLIKWCACVRVY